MSKYKTKEIQLGYPIWNEINETESVSKEDIGKKVWIAGEFQTKFRILQSVHESGEKLWPEGGVSIEEVETGRLRYYTKNKVRLHPDNFKKKIYKSKTVIVRELVQL